MHAADAVVFDRDGDGQAAWSGGQPILDPNTAQPIDEWVDLVEICDAWGKPREYAVRSKAIAAGMFMWELRSAGPDGEFADMFSSEDRSDDVILQGP